MKINEFISALPKDEVKKELFIKSHVVRQYIPLAEKKARAELVISASYYNEERQFRIDSVSRHMLTALSFVLAYTDLELSGENSALSDYDGLCEAKIFRILQSYVPGEEMEEFIGVLEMVGDDAEKNECAPSVYIRNRIDTLATIFAPLVQEMTPLLLERLKPLLDNIDVDELTKLMSEANN